jgi:hypothetical protein
VPDENQQNLHDLSIVFLGYLHRQEGVPYIKGALAREEIYRYILDRHAGELAPVEESLFEAMPRRKPKPKPHLPSLEHVLCPDRSTLDRYLAELLNFINPHYYKAAAMMELVPAWLRFLELHQLMDAQQRRKILNELRGLDTELLKIWESHPEDPALQEGMKRWQEDAEKELTAQA